MSGRSGRYPTNSTGNSKGPDIHHKWFSHRSLTALHGRLASRMTLARAGRGEWWSCVESAQVVQLQQVARSIESILRARANPRLYLRLAVGPGRD